MPNVHDYVPAELLSTVELAGGPKWRNWQTRGVQGAVHFCACGFKSHLRHHGVRGASKMFGASGNCCHLRPENVAASVFGSSPWICIFVLGQLCPMNLIVDQGLYTHGCIQSGIGNIQESLDSVGEETVSLMCCQCSAQLWEHQIW